jgi:hypothetical protein
MCNLCHVTTTSDAVPQFMKAFRNGAGWNEASFDIYATDCPRCQGQ